MQAHNVNFMTGFLIENSKELLTGRVTDVEMLLSDLFNKRWDEAFNRSREAWFRYHTKGGHMGFAGELALAGAGIGVEMLTNPKESGRRLLDKANFIGYNYSPFWMLGAGALETMQMLLKITKGQNPQIIHNLRKLNKIGGLGLHDGMLELMGVGELMDSLQSMVDGEEVTKEVLKQQKTTEKANVTKRNVNPKRKDFYK